MDPLKHSKYMRNCPSMAPLRVSRDMTIVDLVENVFSCSSYQARNLAKAARLWSQAELDNKYVWITLAGAAAPAGLTGIVSQLIKDGLVDGVVSTGANIFHDLHYVFGLPVRQGDPQVDDNDLRFDGTTRIYDTNVRNRETLKAQDMFNRIFAKKVFEDLKPPFSTATFLYALGHELLKDNSGMVKNKKDSLVITAFKQGVPIFLDSGANHSLGMDLASLYAEGVLSDTSPSRDVIEAAALSWRFQPQFNIFIGEGGPRNFLQTTGPTASEIFYIPFEGSGGGVILSVADERAGALSGSTFSEAVSWGKYTDASMLNKVVVWGEYSITFPILASYIMAKILFKEPKMLMSKKDETKERFLEEAKKHAAERAKDYNKLLIELRDISDFESKGRSLS